MKKRHFDTKNRSSRWQHLKLTPVLVCTLAGTILGAHAASQALTLGRGNHKPLEEFYPTHYSMDRYSYMKTLRQMSLSTPLEADEMRVTFMGSSFPMAHRAAAEMSVFVEVGWDTNKHVPKDQFVFDIGSGSQANYTSAGIDFARMNKIFLNHLHADHITDLIHVYSFGNAGSRKKPLYVWGNKDTGLPNPGNSPVITNSTPWLSYNASPATYHDGVSNMCFHLREALRWQTESQAFQSSAFTTYPRPDEVKAMWGLPSLPLPVSDDPAQDSNALIPIELDHTKKGEGFRPDGVTRDNVAYLNQDTGATVSHFPVIHNRVGALGYKLEWDYPGKPANARPLTLVYASDTKPETNSIWQSLNIDRQGKTNGIDVFIHEMNLAPEALTIKSAWYTQPPTNTDKSVSAAIAWSNGVYTAKQVEDSSHTPQGAFGYMLSQIKPRPRLAVASHFPTADDTVACALASVQVHCPEIKKNGDKLVWSADLMVIRVFPDKIQVRKAIPNDYAIAAASSENHTNTYAPKYHAEDGSWDPVVQLDRSAEIPPVNPDSTVNYREDGY